MSRPIEFHSAPTKPRRPRRPLVEVGVVEAYSRPGPECFDDRKVELCMIEPWVDGSNRHFHYLGDARIREHRRRVLLTVGAVAGALVAILAVLLAIYALGSAG